MGARAGPDFRKELPLSQLFAICPGPNGWISGAQAALDELATTRTLGEVEVCFGSARRLSELVLGFPVSGGHATRRAIRVCRTPLVPPTRPVHCR